MNRRCCLATLGVAVFAAVLRAADPVSPQGAGTDYRMTFVSLAGKISLPDEPTKKTYFIDLSALNKEPPQKFGGPTGERFVAWRLVKKVATHPRTGLEREVATLVCVEVATNQLIHLAVGQEVNLAKKE